MEKIEKYDYMLDLAISNKQYEKAQEILDAIKSAGYEDFYISRSISDSGVSTYIQGPPRIKFRISDHSVESYHRMMSEHFFDYDTPVSKILDIIKKEKEKEKIISDEYEKQAARQKEIRAHLDQKWKRIKSSFAGYVFPKMERTYKDITEIKNENPNRKNIIQKFLCETESGKAYYYEWAEPKYPGSYASSKPSYEFLNLFEENENNI